MYLAWRCERHGVLAKEASAKAFGVIEMEPPEEVAELMNATVSAKHRLYNRGGYAPYQIVFGRMPCLSQSLLSDDPYDEAGLQDLVAEGREDSAAATFRRFHQFCEAGSAAMASLDATRGSHIRRKPERV